MNIGLNITSQIVDAVLTPDQSLNLSFENKDDLTIKVPRIRSLNHIKSNSEKSFGCLNGFPFVDFVSISFARIIQPAQTYLPKPALGILRNRTVHHRLRGGSRREWSDIFLRRSSPGS